MSPLRIKPPKQRWAPKPRTPSSKTTIKRIAAKQGRGVSDAIPRYAKRLLDRLNAHDLTLCRWSSDTDEALTKGGGHKPAPPASSKLLIDRGLVSPQNDGLLPDSSQTYRVARG